MSFIYHERQLGALCGVHCLNNLLQGPHFGPGDLAEIGVELDQQERLLLGLDAGGGGGGGAGAGGSSSAGVGASGASPVLAQVEGVEKKAEGASGEEAGVKQAEGEGAAASADVPEPQCYNVDSSADGGNFSIQVLTLALKRRKLELLPSKHPRARVPMQDPAEATEAFLLQCRDHWFAVRKVADCWWNVNSTRKRPAMVSPFYLAAWLGQLGAEGHTIFLVTGEKLPEPAKPQDESKPEENFHEIFDLLEQGKKTGGNPLAGGDADDEEVVIPPDPEDDAEAARALAAADEAERQGVSTNGQLYDEMLRVQMQAQMRTQQAMQRPRPQPQTGSPVRPADQQQWSWMWPGLQGVLSGGGGSAGAGAGGTPAAVGSNAGAPRASQNNEAQSMREMGFREPQIRVAQELARVGTTSTPALQLLLGAETREVTGGGEQLARLIQEEVLSLDTAAFVAFNDRLLKTVHLLSQDQALLEEAKAHLSSEALGEFLRTLLRNRKGWPPTSHTAGTIVVGLLETFPSGAAAMEEEALAARSGRPGVQCRMPASALPRKPAGDDDCPSGEVMEL